MSNAALNVATEIRNQLGGQALAMMGAQNLVGDANSLQFKVRGSKTVTHIKVELDADDTYTVRFYKIRGLNVAELEPMSMVYADQLHEIIQSKTGLYLSL